MVPDPAMVVRHLAPALLVFAALLGPALPATAQVSAPVTGDEANLARIFAEEAARQDQLDPMAALYRGKKADAGALAQIFSDALDRRRLASARTSLRALARIDRAKLSVERQVSHDVFRLTMQEQADWLQPDIRMLTAVRPLTHFGGLHVEFPTLMASGGALPFASEADYRLALALDGAFAQVLDNAVARFRQGMASGVTESRLTTRNMIVQIDRLLAQPPEQSPFYSPVLNFPASVPPASQEKLRADFGAVIRDRIYPAYRRLRDFLADEYLPAAREAPGLLAMKGGSGLYRRLIERETTLRLDPEAVHTLGQGEVARIQREMDGVRRKLGYRGPLREFFDAIRRDPRFHPTSKQELAEGYAAVARTVDGQIPRFFSRLPKSRLLIEPYPAYREQFEAGGSYNQGSPDGTRPGVFFYNTYDLPSRFLSGIATLYLHEGAPGHHFQISLAQEDTSLPDFQRFDGNNAFVEGWALYAETLGFEMGLYKDPMQHWGTLDDEMLRAMRLVVDTGIHAKGWSRERAIEYMLANSGMGRTDATAEVERYIANPAQALSYKIGALTIQRLRKKAEVALGGRFDIRAFHEQVLGSGALPLPVLEAKIDRWIVASE
jgi:uncharacterized protein (DUF885 family)